MLLFYVSYRSKLFTLNEVLSQLEDGDDNDLASADIFISPPGDGQNSDEDDMNEDTQDGVFASDLPGRQLRSAAQARVKLRDGSQVTLGDVSRKCFFTKLYAYLYHVCVYVSKMLLSCAYS